MKKMKHIMLFEAFDSKTLSKTLSFLSKDDREKLKETLENILDGVDDGKGGTVKIPMSLLSDEFFAYMPYQKALETNYSGDTPDCPSCKGTGKIRKPHGRGFRNADCPSCKGSGKGETTKKKKYFKFWINTEGKLVLTTVSDGTYRLDRLDKSTYDLKDITEDIKQMGAREVKDKHGIANGKTMLRVEKVKTASWRAEYDYTGPAFVDTLNSIFLLCDDYNASSGLGIPTGRKWKEYGSHSLNLDLIKMDYNSRSKVYIASPAEEKKDIYWNAIYSGGRPAPVTTNRIREAHAAIVFDYDAFRQWFLSSGNKAVGQIKTEREASKGGSYAMMSPDKIRKANIERYAKAMAGIDLSQGIGRVMNKIPAILGGQLALYFLKAGINQRVLGQIADLAYDFMDSKSTEQIESINKEITRVIDEALDRSRSWSEKIDKAIAESKQAANQNPEENKHVLPLIQKIEDASKALGERIRGKRPETIEDIELLMIMLKGVGEMLGNRMNYKVSRYIDACAPKWDFDATAALRNIRVMGEEEANEEIAKLDRIKRVIER